MCPFSFTLLSNSVILFQWNDPFASNLNECVLIFISFDSVIYKATLYLLKYNNNVVPKIIGHQNCNIFWNMYTVLAYHSLQVQKALLLLIPLC